jgi:hypothetical protein
MTLKADASGQTPFGGPSPDQELKRLEPLLGESRSEDRTLERVLGPGVSVTSTERFYWLDGGYFLVSSHETLFGDEPAQRGVNTGAMTPMRSGSGSSSSRETARTPRTAIATRGR